MTLESLKRLEDAEDNLERILLKMRSLGPLTSFPIDDELAFALNDFLDKKYVVDHEDEEEDDE